MYFVTLRLNVLTWRTCKRVGKSEKWWSLGSVRSRGLGVTRLRLQRVMDSSLCLQNSWTTGNGQTFPDFGHLQSFHFSHVDWKPASGVRFHGNLGDQETDSPHLVKVPKNQSVSALVSPGFWSFPFLSSHVCRRVLLMSGTATPVLCTLSLGTEGVLQLCQCEKKWPQLSWSSVPLKEGLPTSQWLGFTLRDQVGSVGSMRTIEAWSPSVSVCENLDLTEADLL
jgi:hypothetical protein